jgi:hypothetical protein
MSYFVALAVGWLLGIFTPHILEPLCRWIGTVWHLATRKRLDGHDSITYTIHKQVKIELVRKFFRIPSPHNR